VMSTKTRGRLRVSEGVERLGLDVPGLSPYPPFLFLSNITVHSTCCHRRSPSLYFLLPSIESFSPPGHSRQCPFLCSVSDCSVRLNVTYCGLL
jgi:hypothetical protein